MYVHVFWRSRFFLCEHQSQSFHVDLPLEHPRARHLCKGHHTADTHTFHRPSFYCRVYIPKLRSHSREYFVRIKQI
ncbi:hypothetical protein PENTCL1PPCAC_9573 [Pristionchus entomophagus]|uniref:Uncharacterized protein n=1 Tax=Pristionchus entomophagus TaxID=358040 RepID=A0AAV5SZI2_9BILA|nr:hypothetical protein PENTCL1PPCAC_9573 [Pristionchus entomophagus]